MIRAFSTTDKIYSSNGDAVILPSKARVKNSDNGDFYLDLICSSDYKDYVQPNNIIVAPTPGGDQAFRIRTVKKKGQNLEATAWHVFYDGLNYLIADSYAVNKNCNDALNHFNNATDNTSPFTMYSNITKVNTYRCVRTSLAECISVVIERWGGHLVRDNWDISVLSTIGKDNGITIEYKKNLKELTASYDWASVCTKLMPVGKDGILLDERYIYSTTQYSIPFTKSVNFDQDIERDDYESEAAYIAALKTDLRNQARNYVAVACIPTINYTLKGNPEKVADIGDIIEVRDSRIGVNVLTSVISYEYDAISNKYVSLEFGNFTPNLSTLMSDIKNETALQISNATANINIEINTIVDAIAALSGLVGELDEDKQDKLYAGSYIEFVNNIINCKLSAGDGIAIGTDSKIKLAALGSTTFKDNAVVTIDNNVAELYVKTPRPLSSYTIASLALSIYTTPGSNTTVDLTDQTTDITITSELINSYTLKITVTDAGSTLTGLAGAYNSYMELGITA